MPTFYLGAGLGAFFAGYGHLVKGHNMLWLVGGFVPLMTLMVYNNSSQPEQLHLNCYRYLLAKKQASVELQEKTAAFNKNSFVSTSEFKQLQGHLSSTGKTLYELEQELVNKIDSKQF